MARFMQFLWVLVGALATTYLLTTGELVGGAIGVVVTLFVAIMWFLMRDVDTTQADEQTIVAIFGTGGSTLSSERLEARLEEIADPAGAYSGERLEDLHLALERLKSKGRLRESCGEWKLV